MAKKIKYPAFEVYETTGGITSGDKWYWRLVARNKKTLLDSGEAYATKSNAVRAIVRLRRTLQSNDCSIVTLKDGKDTS